MNRAPEVKVFRTSRARFIFAFYTRRSVFSFTTGYRISAPVAQTTSRQTLFRFLSHSLTILALLPFLTFSFNALRVSTINLAFSQMP